MYVRCNVISLFYRNERPNIFKPCIYAGITNMYTRQICLKQQCAIELLFFFVYHGETPKKLPLPSLKKQKYSQKRAKSVFICSYYNTVHNRWCRKCNKACGY